MLKQLLNELSTKFEETNIMPDSIIEKMHNELLNSSKNYSIKLKHHIVQLILSHYVNIQKPNITEKYAYLYLQIES